MTTAPTDAAQTFEISPLYSDYKVRVPLDDGSGFHNYNLHLCMLRESPYFREMKRDPKKVRSLPTLKSHFDIILRYIYDRNKPITYSKDNILDLITEGYRYKLEAFVRSLWNSFATSADENMVIMALRCIEEKVVPFRYSWDFKSLYAAIRRNILGVFDQIHKVHKYRSIRLLAILAANQNPELIVQKLRRWGEQHPTVQARQIEVEYLNAHKTPKNRLENCGEKTIPFTLQTIEEENSFLRTYSRIIFLPCVRGSKRKNAKDETLKYTLEVLSLSPLTISYTSNDYSYNKFLTRIKLWDPTETYCIIKETSEHISGWVLNFEIRYSYVVSKYLHNIYPVVPDFTVVCPSEKGPVAYRLHKFILQQSKHFARMFASSKFIESRTNQAKLETPQKLFDVILRYLYNQDPFTDITSFITDVIQEASYFELNDFEQSLWELFEKKADANNCIKAIILMDSNALFEMRKPIIMKAAANCIKGILGNIRQISRWNTVEELLDLKNTKNQNPVLILQAVRDWCERYDPANAIKEVTKVFEKHFKEEKFALSLVLELKTRLPYPTKILQTEAGEVVDSFSVKPGEEFSDNRTWNISSFVIKSDSMVEQTKKEVEHVFLCLHDQLSEHSVTFTKYQKLSDVIQNLEEWKVHGEYYRISFS